MTARKQPKKKGAKKRVKTVLILDKDEQGPAFDKALANIAKYRDIFAATTRELMKLAGHDPSSWLDQEREKEAARERFVAGYVGSKRAADYARTAYGSDRLATAADIRELNLALVGAIASLGKQIVDALNSGLK